MRPNSRVGQSRIINLASDVPPLVESSGVNPVTAFIDVDTSSEKTPGAVKKETALLGKKSSSTVVEPAAVATTARTRSLRLSSVQLSLNLTLNCALAVAGMTFTAALPISMDENSRFVRQNARCLDQIHDGKAR